MANHEFLNDWPSTNHLLARVPFAEQAILSRHMTTVALAAGQFLYEPGSPLDHVYLPTSGIISLVVVMSDGNQAEMATIGCEGVAGMSASGYVDAAFNRISVQISGQAQRVSAASFEDMVDTSVRFCSAVSRYRDVLTRTSLQSGACNALHSVRRRCARWILTAHDRVAGDRLPITQEFLAAMLGVKRNAVSVVAREFQAAKLIEVHWGNLSVIDRDGIAVIACECYDIIRQEIVKLASDEPSPECND